MATIIKIVVHGQLEWRAVRSSTSQRWIGVCDPINISMEADSLDELHSVISETIHVLLTDLLHDNELERYLRERGWQAHNVPERPNIRGVKFDVPWQLIVQGTRDSERRAH